MVSLQCIAIPLFYSSNKDKEFLFNFRQQHEAFINTDMRGFKIQMSDMAPSPPPLQRRWQIFSISPPQVPYAKFFTHNLSIKRHKVAFMRMQISYCFLKNYTFHKLTSEFCFFLFFSESRVLASSEVQTQTNCYMYASLLPIISATDLGLTP